MEPATPPAPATLDLGQLRRSCASCALGQLCLPAGIGGEDLNRLDQLVRSNVVLDRGTVLFGAGQPLTKLYLVKSGALKTYAEDEEGELQILGFHLPGEIVGFDGLADDTHRCSAEALSRASVCEVPFDRLESVAAQVPGLQRQLMRVVSREVVKDHEHLVMMGRRQAMDRLAIFLHSLSTRYKRLGFSGDEFVLPMSRYELANYLGLVVETVSRLFTRLAELGILEVERKTIRIRDHARLEAMIGDEHSADRPITIQRRKGTQNAVT